METRTRGIDVRPDFSRPNLAELFYHSASVSPESQALGCEDLSLTYAQLLDLVESVRVPLGADGSEFVGILAYRSPLAYAAVQAILAEGKAYVPLNPLFPASRNAYILRKARITTLIVGEECADSLSALLPELRKAAHPIRLVFPEWMPSLRSLVDAAGEAVLPIEMKMGSALSPTPVKAIPEDGSAYVLFTSGSTGVPKGVRVRHDNVLSYLRSFLAAYPIYPHDRISQTFDLTFDVSVHDQFITWAVGAVLIVFPVKSLFSPLAYAAAQKLTIWFSVPARAAFLESARLVVPGALPDVRISLFAGEKLTWKTCEIWKRIAPQSRILNLYGPTEATVAFTHFEIPEDFPETRAYQGGIPIGRAWPGQSVQVRAADGSLCRAGQAGSLWLAGDQLAPGYLDEPEKTAERFISRDGTLWYRTGDLVIEEADGALQYLGREDFQVKVMGYRIELGEIEHALMNCSGAAFALADVAAIRGGMEEIFCVLPGHLAESKKEITLSLKRLLPAYMVPRHIFFIDDVPLNANGKMDRGALKAQLTRS